MRGLLLPCLTLLPAWAAPALAQADAALLERRVKAAFLYKFAGYIAWPEGAFALAESAVVIGVLGDELLASELVQAVEGRSVEGRPLAVRRITDPAPSPGVHMLFVATAHNARLPALARAMRGQPVVLVSETEGALGQGSMINFVVSGGRVKFEIAPGTAERNGVKLSSRLLTVAQAVRSGNLQ